MLSTFNETGALRKVFKMGKDDPLVAVGEGNSGSGPFASMKNNEELSALGYCFGKLLLFKCQADILMHSGVLLAACFHSAQHPVPNCMG